MAEQPLDEHRFTEEIEGAPSAETPEAIRQRNLRETLSLNSYLYRQSRQLEYMLLGAADLQSLLEVLLVNLPRHFGLSAAELWLYDPEQVLGGLMADPHRYGADLQLHGDVFAMQELYDLEPAVELVDAADTRMFEVLKSSHGIEQGLLVPLQDGGRVIGSFHCGIGEPSFPLGANELAHIAHLGTIISLCFRNVVSSQQISRLTMIDPLTQISNLRGFEKDIARELSRARRADQPVSVLMVNIDEYNDLYQHYGEVTGQFLVKKISERISSGLRTTDYLARLDSAQLAVLVPGSGEVLAGDIAERIRQDIEHFAVDDGRGASLEVTVSVGYACWEPQQFPAIDMRQLARQIENTAAKALEQARREGGNRCRVNRLTTLMV
ncbi:GGDEF domain-containing protein [Parahaliea aestuarii]|uniref:diguanylate cyclase n=1 Tax=Parahaliea aestuarii TaxID=1852021 RepID=A0A5C9A5G3_9GAMM|nr:GGDEF domain-containing protein [Parahaliea aestuarii]TXS94980.1 GGDEF domain-containing protein [Parahaliea aestuarii]